MRILFAGTPELAVPTLRRLADEHDVCAVLTAPDKPSGRGRKLTPPPVKRAAEELDLPVLQPERLAGEARRDVTTHHPALLVCVAYGKIFGPKFLDLFARGAINLHPSLLPRFRGPAPIPATILAGDELLGISVQALSLDMDAGAIYAQQRVPLSGSETTGELSALAAERGARLMSECVAAIRDGAADPTPQDEAYASYCGLIRKADGEMDFSRSAVELDRMVRAYNPWPGAYTTLEGHNVTIHRAEAAPAAATGASGGLSRSGGAALEPGQVLDIDKEQGVLVQTGNGILAVGRLQLQGKKPLEWDAFVNGYPGVKRAIFGR